MGTRSNRVAEAVLTGTHNLCFEQKCEKYQNFLSDFFSFIGCESFTIFEQVFVMIIVCVNEQNMARSSVPLQLA